MSPDDPQWNEFIERLHGPEGCNFHYEVDNDPLSLRWDCNRKHTLSKRILAKMGLTRKEIASSLEFFEQNSGFCSCEILLNVARRVEQSRRLSAKEQPSEGKATGLPWWPEPAR